MDRNIGNHNTNHTNELLFSENEDVSELIGTIDTFLDDLNATIDTMVQKKGPVRELQQVLPHVVSNDFVTSGRSNSEIDFAFQHHDTHINNTRLQSTSPMNNQQASSEDVAAPTSTATRNRRQRRGSANKAICTDQQSIAAATTGTKTSQERLVVKHDYCDYTSPTAVTPIADFQRMLQHRASSCMSFPQTLHIILEHANEGGYDDIVSWQSHGRAFRVHNQMKFITQIMPNFFQQTRFASFQRQLALYGFIRLTRKGKDFGAYYHAKFLRGYPHLTYTIQRTPVKGTFVQKMPSPETEPDFYAMKPAGLNCNQPQQLQSSFVCGPESKLALPSTLSSSSNALPSSLTSATMPSLSTSAAMYMSTQEIAIKDYFSSILSSIVNKGTLLDTNNNNIREIGANFLPSHSKVAKTKKNTTSSGFSPYHSSSSPLITPATISCIDQSTSIPWNITELVPSSNNLLSIPVPTPTVSKSDATTAIVVQPNPITSSSVLDSELFAFTDDELLLPAVATDAIVDIRGEDNDDNLSLSDYLNDADWDDGFTDLMIEDDV